MNNSGKIWLKKLPKAHVFLWIEKPLIAEIFLQSRITPKAAERHLTFCALPKTKTVWKIIQPCATMHIAFPLIHTEISSSSLSSSGHRAADRRPPRTGLPRSPPAELLPNLVQCGADSTLASSGHRGPQVSGSFTLACSFEQRPRTDHSAAIGRRCRRRRRRFSRKPPLPTGTY